MTRLGPRALALAGAATIAFSGILVRLSQASPSTAAMFRCVYALPLLWALARREDRRLGPRSWHERRAGLLAGVFFAIDNLLWNHSILDVGAGLATVLANVQVVVVPLVAWVLLAEVPSRRLLAALPVSLFGVLLISGVLEHGAFGRDPTRGTLFGLGAGLAYVGFLLLLRHGSGSARRAAAPLFEATVVSAVVCLLGGVVVGDLRPIPSWPSAGWLVALALGSQVIGWLLISASLPRLPAGIASVMLTFQPLGAVGLAALILGESPSLLQLGGVALVLVALLSASGASPTADAAERLGGAPPLEATQQPGGVPALDATQRVLPLDATARSYRAVSARPTTSGAVTARARASASALAPGSSASRATTRARACTSPGATSQSSGTSSGSAPIRDAATGSPAAIASAAASPNVSANSDGASATDAWSRSCASCSPDARPTKRAPAAPDSSRPRSGPSPAITSVTPARAQAAIAASIPFSGTKRAASRAGPPARGTAGSGDVARTTCGTTAAASPSGTPSACSRVSAKRLGAAKASTWRSSRCCQSASPAP